MLQSLTSTKSVDQLRQYYRKVRNHTMHLVSPLETEDYVVQPSMDVSPPKWHMAHTTWFFETFILKPQKKHYKEFNKYYNYLFNSYYATVGDRWTRAKRGHLTRPTVAEIVEYRQYVDKQMEDWLSSTNRFTDELSYVFEIGLQHEEQHQELLLYDIKNILGDNPLFPAYRNNNNQTKASENVKLEWLSVPEGVYEIGFDREGFCFDNEKGRHKKYLQAFEIASRTVTNGEYLDFMESGGYMSPRFWMMDGFEWIQANQVNSPKYWHKLDGDWYVYQLTGLEKIDLNAPVSHISFYEADAFARWKGMRLPTEEEWEVAAQKFEPDFATNNFVEQENYKPIAGNHQFMGNLWEYTESAYRPYPNYKAPEGALGEYNGKFMINQMVLRGGSYATPVNHVRYTYRNFFHPHLQWLFNGIRLAKYI